MILIAVIWIVVGIRVFLIPVSNKFIFNKELGEICIEAKSIIGIRTFRKYSMSQVVQLGDEERVDTRRLSLILISGKRIKLFEGSVEWDDEKVEWNRLIQLIDNILKV